MAVEFTQLNIEATKWYRVNHNTQYAKEVIADDWTLFETYIIEKFKTPPICFDDAWYGNPTGTGGDENRMYIWHNYFEYHMLWTQTIVAPTWGANGLDIGLDQTDNDGVEVTNWITARSPMYFDVSSDNVYFKITATIEDVSGSDDFCVWFRKAEAYQANVDDYDEAAYIAWDGTNLDTEAILNGWATSNADSWLALADATEFTLEVRVINRVATFYKDGSILWTYVSHTFDANEKIIPFVYVLHSTDVAGYVRLTHRECGKLVASTQQ